MRGILPGMAEEYYYISIQIRTHPDSFRGFRLLREARSFFSGGEVGVQGRTNSGGFTKENARTVSQTRINKDRYIDSDGTLLKRVGVPRLSLRGKIHSLLD